jgi:hypothetical protein
MFLFHVPANMIEPEGGCDAFTLRHCSIRAYSVCEAFRLLDICHDAGRESASAGAAVRVMVSLSVAVLAVL